MDDGIHRISDDEVQLIRASHVERSVQRTVAKDVTAVTSTKTVYYGPDADPDADPSARFATEVREVQDAWNHVTRCGFCEKTSSEVQHIIAGPTVHICDECVQVCNRILAEE